MGSIWNSANKIVNLRKTWPVGATTFGQATLRGQSISGHCKGLRLMLSGRVVDAEYPALDPSSYTIEQVARRLHSYFRRLVDQVRADDVLGFLVGGINPGQASPELWHVTINNVAASIADGGSTPHDGGDGGEPEESRPVDEAAQGPDWTIVAEVKQLAEPGESGIYHQGMTNAITRLVDGAGQGLGQALVTLGVPAEQSEDVAHNVRARLQFPWAWSGIPAGESIDLARFLVDTTINFVRFMPGDLMVGGPIEIARSRATKASSGSSGSTTTSPT